MQKKLNEDFIDSYCEKFAKKVTGSFFTDEKETISGKEILEVTPSKQTNFFIVKLLFRYWQAESKKLESPFFNYKHEEVKKAMKEFMSVLSQHIEVHKNNFQLLLNHALKDSIYLAAAPGAYVEIDLDSRGVDQITEKVISGTLKYIRIHKKEISNFLSDMKGLTIDDVIDEIPEEFEEFDTTESLRNETDLLSEIIPIRPDQVMSEVDMSDFDDFDDEFFDNDDEEDRPGPSAPKVSVEEEPAPEELPEDGVKWEAEQIAEDHPPIATDNDPKETEEESEEAKVDEKIEEEPTADEPVEEETESETINDRFQSTEETVAEHHERNSESSLMKLISVNHQYMFVKELFQDDQVSFQNALYDLEEYDSFDEAVEFLVQNYAKEFKWDMQSNEVKELLKVLFRKFRS